uniref:Uncharacterized protein n=1 Tax=Helianthus annuus TaxID=4232 RepID=A0A251UQB0_HELAN
METSAPADLLRTVSQDPLWSVEGAQQPEKWQPLVFNALETKNSCFPIIFIHHNSLLISSFSSPTSLELFPAIGDLLPEFLSVSQHKTHLNP